MWYGGEQDNYGQERTSSSLYKEIKMSSNTLIKRSKNNVWIKIAKACSVQFKNCIIKLTQNGKVRKEQIRVSFMASLKNKPEVNPTATCSSIIGLTI